jgi:hypothetical protein
MRPVRARHHSRSKEAMTESTAFLPATVDPATPKERIARPNDLTHQALQRVGDSS